MRGTNPSLTQTLLNGHNVASGDWFVLNQVGQVGRSVSYTLLPSELVEPGRRAQELRRPSLVEGGVAGSVDIITRRPLDFAEQLTLEGIGRRASTPSCRTRPTRRSARSSTGRTTPTPSACMLQAFSEERHLRRDGVEILGYQTIAPGSAIALSNPDLAGVVYPRLIGAALFEQERKRTGGLIDMRVPPDRRPAARPAQYFMSELEATNYNRNYMFWAERFVNSAPGQAPDPGYVVRNNTLVAANFSPVVPARNRPCRQRTRTTTQHPDCRLYGIYDQISRPDEKATSNYWSFEAEYRVSDALELSGQIGTSEGHGETPTQDVSETHPARNSGASWQLNGLGSAPDFNFGTADTSTPVPGGTPVLFGWIFGAQLVDVEDEENWAQIDADFAVDRGAWTGLQFGARYNEHTRESLNDAIAPGPDLAGGSTGDGGRSGELSADTSRTIRATSTPSAARSRRTSGSGRRRSSRSTTATAIREPRSRRCAPYCRAASSRSRRRTSAGYVQANFEGSSWSGNIGLRYVQTEEHVVHLRSATTDDRSGRDPRTRSSARSNGSPSTTPMTTGCRART